MAPCSNTFFLSNPQWQWERKWCPLENKDLAKVKLALREQNPKECLKNNL